MSYPITPAPRKRSKLPWILGGIAVLVIVFCGVLGVGSVVVGGKAVSDISTAEAAKPAAVKIDSCTKDEFDFVQIKYTIKNDSGSKQTYLPQFELVDKKTGNRLGTAAGIEPDVAPGMTVKGTATGTIEGNAAFACRVLNA
jgi:hypothetical protein